MTSPRQSNRQDTLVLNKRLSTRLDHLLLYTFFVAPCAAASYYYVAVSFNAVASGKAALFLLVGVPLLTLMLVSALLEKVELSQRGMQFYTSMNVGDKQFIRRETLFVSWNEVKRLHLQEGNPEVEIAGTGRHDSESIKLSSFKESEAGCAFIAEHLPESKVAPELRNG